LSRDEGASLAVGQARLAGDLGLGNALDTALEKITGAGIAASREHILVDVDPWMRSGEAVPALPAVHDGLIRGRRLDLDYRDGETRERRLTVHPLGLVAKAGIWYLIATPDGEADPALFRMSRVRGCATRPEPAARPADFDLEAAWSRLRRRVEVRQRDLEVTVTAAGPTAPMVRRVLAGHTRSTDGDTLRLAFNGVDHAVGSLLGLGTKINIKEPTSVREAMRAAAAEVVALYA
jgi:predicted DNA-binding transcriptional regulator YafY